MKKKKTEEVIFFENLMKAAKAVEKKVQKRKEYEEALNNEVLKRIENGEFTSDQLVQIYNINNEASIRIRHRISWHEADFTRGFFLDPDFS